MKLIDCPERFFFFNALMFLKKLSVRNSRLGKDDVISFLRSVSKEAVSPSGQSVLANKCDMYLNRDRIASGI